MGGEVKRSSLGKDALHFDKHSNSAGELDNAGFGEVSLFLTLQEMGPTLCGDEKSDPELMTKLGAKLQLDSGQKL